MYKRFPYTEQTVAVDRNCRGAQERLPTAAVGFSGLRCFSSVAAVMPALFGPQWVIRVTSEQAGVKFRDVLLIFALSD